MRTLAIALVILLFAGFGMAQDTQVTASIGGEAVGVQDQFQFTITVSGRDSGDAEQPRLPVLNGFRVVAGPSVSTQFQWINGRTSSNKSFTYVLLPEKEGQFTIDPAEVRVGGKVYRSQPLHIRVTSATPRARIPQQPRSVNPLNPFDPFGGEEDFPASRPAADAVLVKAELDRSSAFPGQQVTLSYRVYTQVGISQPQLQESPPLSGFWVEDLEVEKNQKGVRQVVNGREYLVFTVKKQALFATTTGTLKIPSSIFAMSADPGGGIFGVFGRSETLYRRTQELSLDVRPIPAAGRPANFNNAVGSFKLSSSADKSRVATGEAVALQVKLDGLGNLKMIPDISLPVLPDLTVYSSKHTDTVRPSAGDQIGGSKIWEFVLVPKTPGRQTIPAIAFSFFDAEQEKFATVETPAIALDVVRGADSPGVSGLSGSEKQDLVRRGTDINFIKLSTEDIEETGTPFHRSRWIFVLGAIPLLFNAGLLILQRQRSKLSTDAGFARSRKAKNTALQRLKTAEKAGKSETRRFYDQAAAALSGYLSERFNIPEIELTGDHLERVLSQSAIPRETFEETRACLQECDFGRFVSASSSGDKMHSLARRIRSNIDDLEKNLSRSSTVRFNA